MMGAPRKRQIPVDEVIIATFTLAVGLWPWSNPPPVLSTLYAIDPELRRARLEFAPSFDASPRRSSPG